MPIVKIHRKGVPNDDNRIIKTNVRLPEERWRLPCPGRAVKTGERRSLDMTWQYGRDAVVGGIARSWSRARRLLAPRARNSRWNLRGGILHGR